MNRKNMIMAGFLSCAALLASCSNTQSSSQPSASAEPSSMPSVEESSAKEQNYEEVGLTVYKTKEAPEAEKFPVRFYKDTPNIPYANVLDFYKVFFAHDDYTLTHEGSTYLLENEKGGFVNIDVKTDIMITKNLSTFEDHKEAPSESGKYFLNLTEVKYTGYVDKVIPLYEYAVDIHGDGDDLYMPISFLSLFSGSGILCNVVYNGKDLFFFDIRGYLSDGVAKNINYYGDLYLEPLKNLDTKRPKDVIDSSYGMLCLTFDHFRGLTSKLSFGDNNLLSLGSDGILELYFPRAKELLLSENKMDYFCGYNFFLGGMFDGGHTLSLMPMTDPLLGLDNYKDYLDPEIYADEIAFYSDEYARPLLATQFNSLIFGMAKASKLPYVPEISGVEGNPNYYYFDSSTKTAYIGFDSFLVDYKAWDDYYKNGMNPDDIPLDTDSFAFVLSKFHQAKNDNATNLVLDLSTNGGGNSDALVGILSLFNKGKGYFSSNQTMNHTRKTEYFDVDINLDGLYNQADIEEAQQFNFNYGVLTARGSFSCGNLLPSLLKELGVKIIGERSGGGSCSVHLSSTTDGMIFAHSSYNCLSDRSGNNIDAGVPVDHELQVGVNELSPALISADSFYDLADIGNYLSTAYNQN